MDQAVQLNELSIEKFGRHIDNQMFLNSEQLNRIMKIFSVISVLFLPPAVIGGLFGMNVKVPMMVGDPDTDSLWPFFGLLIFAAVWTLIMFFIMWRYKMTGRSEWQTGKGKKNCCCK